MQTTIKVVNYQHMMPTRYTLDVDLRSLFTNDVLAERKRQKETCQVGLKPRTQGCSISFSPWLCQVGSCI